MEIPAHIDALRAEGARMVAAVGAADAGAAVPTCPGWTVRDLTRHAGSVHRWATGFVATGRTDPAGGGIDDVVGPADGELAGWLADGCDALVAALEGAPDDMQCWTFLAAPSPRAMWARRQAHETAIHRVDAQVAAGIPVTPCAPAFSADGIDELLMLFVPRRSAQRRADPPVTLAVRCTDVDASWLVRLDADGVAAAATTGSDDTGATCTLRGTAGDLYLALWNRADPVGLDLEGEGDVLGRFVEGVRIR
jgi:uncharacterized protein (TIGR03083 family)